MDTKEKATHRSLDARIADALNGEIITSAALSDLIIAVEDALPLSAAALESERVRLVDPTNRDPEKTKATVDKITLEIARLEAAIPMLEQRYHRAQHHERKQALLPEYNEVVENFNETSVALTTAYLEFCERFLPMLSTAVRLNDAIRKMNARASGLGLTTIPPSRKDCWKVSSFQRRAAASCGPIPKQAHIVSVQIAEQMGRVYSSPLRQAAASGDWWAARAISDEEKIKRWEQQNELLERQQADAKAEFEKSKQSKR